MIDPPPMLLVVVGLVAAFVVLAYFSVWTGFVLLVCLCLALALYAWVEGEGES